MNFGHLPMVNQLVAHRGSVLSSQPERLRLCRARIGTPLSAREALELGLVTFAPDELDWADELRQAIEGRTALSPDALTGLEANLRFGDRRPWKRGFSAASRHGRTGFSVVRTRSARLALSKYTAPAIDQSSMGARLMARAQRAAFALANAWSSERT